MSDDTKTKPLSLSTPQATANLDDVLSSLEKQVSGQPPVEAVAAPTPVVSTPPIVQEIPISSPEPTPAVTPIVSPFQMQVAETHIEPTNEIKAPTAEAMPSVESMQEHPQMEESPMTDPSVSEPVFSTPAPSVPEKKGFLSGLSLTPKFVGAALVVALMAIGAVGAYVAFQTPQGTVNQDTKATGCTIDYNGNSFTVSGACANGSNTISIFNGPSCPTTQTNVSRTVLTGGGTFSPNPPSGLCQQVDHDFSGTDFKNPGNVLGAGGVCTCNNPAPAKKSCGESCASDNDCINPSGSGAATVCRNGTCESAACPAGMTEPGVNCACKAGRSCGQTCGTSIGLCNDGRSTCTYINTNGPTCPWGWGTFYCAGSLNGYQRLMCTSGDTGGGYLKGPTGKMSGFTPAEIAQSCTPVQPTATPTPTPTPTTRPTPTPTPTSAPLVCIGISSSNPNPTVGSQVRFTCGKITGATSYEFRYKYSFAGVDQNAATIPANGNVSSPLVISQAATYKVQCRSCVGTSCTPWEAW